MADGDNNSTSKPDEAKASPTDDAAAIAKADNPDAVKAAIDRQKETARAERKRADAAEAKVQEFEDRDKSVQEKAEAKAAEAEKRAQEAELKALRIEVATAKKLPAALAARLSGSTKEELEADADALAKLVKAENSTSFDGGVRTSTGKPSFDDMIRGKA